MFRLFIILLLVLFKFGQILSTTISPQCPTSPADLGVGTAAVLDGDNNYDVKLKHQVFRPNEGLIPGVTYSVVVSISGGGAQRYFNGYFVTITDSNGFFSGEFLMDSFGDAALASINRSITESQRSNGLSYRICNQHKSITWLQPSDDYVMDSVILQWRMTHGRYFNVTAFVYEDGNWYRKSVLYYYYEGCVKSISSAHGIVSELDFVLATDTCSETLLVFEAEESRHRVLQFQSLKFNRNDCSTDYLEVLMSSGPTFDWNNTRICGQLYTQQISTLHFVSDSEPIVLRSNSKDFTFKIIHYTLDRRKKCNETLDSDSGVITSPNYPKNYFPALNCFTHIKVGKEQTAIVRLKYLQLHQMSNGSCSDDYIQLLTSSGRIGRRYCGDDHERYLRPYLTFFASNDVIVHFHSDWFGGGKGFVLDYKLSQPCNTKLHTASEDIIFILNNEMSSIDIDWDNCVTTINVPYGYVIQLNIKSTSTNDDGYWTTENHQLKFHEVQGDSGDVINNERYKCSEGFLELIDKDTTRVLCDIQRWTNISFTTNSNRLLVKITRDLKIKLKSSFIISYKKLALDHSSNNCIYGWSYAWDNCYLFVKEKLNWDDAESYCKARGGHLVSIPSYTVQHFLNNLLENSLFDDENTGVWIGGHDKVCETCYEWSNGQSMVFSNWFKGWPMFGYYGWQPSDDGMSNQDCIEMRTSFTYPTKNIGKTNGFYWNDRDCSIQNPFICERAIASKIKPAFNLNNCNRTVKLNFVNPKMKLSSLFYPKSYPNDADCVTSVSSPSGTRITITFQSFLLEDSPSCEYDYLELISDGRVSRRVCGDWKGRIKLLRHVSTSNQLQIHFVSDHSHAFQGYQLQVRIEGGEACGHERMVRHGRLCYLIVPHPSVTWIDAQEKCAEVKTSLADPRSEDERRFIMTHLIPSSPSKYLSRMSFWLDTPLVKLATATYKSITDNSVTIESEKTIHTTAKLIKCLYFSQTNGQKNSNCDEFKGYICQKEVKDEFIDYNKTLKDEGGIVTSLNHPSNYPHNLDYTTKLIGQPSTRLVFTLISLDIEWQKDCLYDYLGLRSDETEQMIRLCGNEGEKDEHFRFVAKHNVIYLSFHSDYSISGPGFLAQWKSVDISGCPIQTLRTSSGTLTSPNYPESYLDSMSCTSVVETGSDSKWIWLQFQYFWVGNGQGGSMSDEICLDDELSIDMWNSDQLSLSLCGQLEFHLPNLAFVTRNSTFRMSFTSGHQNRAKGYAATFTTLDSPVVQRIINLNSNSTGRLFHLNHPHQPPPSFGYLRKLVLPLSYIFYLQLEGYSPSGPYNDSLCDQWLLEITDPYGESRKFCKSSNESVANEFRFKTKFNVILLHELTGNVEKGHFNDYYYKITYAAVKDPEFKSKTSVDHIDLESCDPNPCVNGGTCSQIQTRRRCICPVQYNGAFCHLTVCDLNPCGHGTCNLTSTGYKCHCQSGYTGQHCESRANPCSPNPCGTRGICYSDNHETFHCRCQIWWQGPLCENKAKHIPYRPLSQRMLEEPFWLGLITVFSVLTFLGCVWCIKRKFADKIERFLTEELDKNQKGSKKHSLRDGGSPASLSPHLGPRSILGRIGLRKHSMLSLDSSDSISPNCHENRSFSLADIGKKSDSQKRLDKLKIQHSESSPAPLDKKELLQSLVTPTTGRSRRMSLDEFFQMSERKILERNNSKNEIFSDCDSISNDETNMDSNVDHRSILRRTHFVRTLEKIDSVSFENEREEEQMVATTDGNLVKMVKSEVIASAFIDNQLNLHLKTDNSDASSIEVDSWGSYDNCNGKSEVLVEIHEAPRQLNNPNVDVESFQLQKLTAELKPISRIAPLNVVTVHHTEIQSSYPKLKLACWDRPGSPTTTGLTPPRIEVSFSNKTSPKRKLLHTVEKTNSLDLPMPLITITSNTSSCESDMDSPVKTQVQMNYLSPFDILRQDSSERSTSLSNLSSSGYSSMTSPGPSRCNSNSPLFYTDNDGSPAHRGQMLHPPSPRHSPLGLTIPKAGFLNHVRPPLQRASAVIRKRSDSETTDDQPEASLPDSDEGIGMDHIDVKIHRGELTCAKDLALYMDYGMGQNSLAEGGGGGENGQEDTINPAFNGAPAIVVQSLHQTELDMVKCWKFVRRKSFQRKLSPVSSRSESPLSDRGPNTNEKYSSLFYTNDNGSFSTDSDDLFDNRQLPSPSEPSSANSASHRLSAESINAKNQQHRKRKSKACTKSKSNNKGVYKRVSCAGSPHKQNKHSRISVDVDSSADETSASSEDFPNNQTNGFLLSKSQTNIDSDEDVFAESIPLPSIVMIAPDSEKSSVDKTDDGAGQIYTNATNKGFKCSKNNCDESVDTVMMESENDR
ncbi:hypothetical protein CHUAL_000018 [Chamberlinius hualienensis]